MGYGGVYKACNENKQLLVDAFGHPIPKDEPIAAALWNLSVAIQNLAQSVEDDIRQLRAEVDRLEG